MNWTSELMSVLENWQEFSLIWLMFKFFKNVKIDNLKGLNSKFSY